MMLQRARLRCIMMIAVTRSIASSPLSSPASASPSSSSSLSAHLELYRIIFRQRTPTALGAKPSNEQLLLQKILKDNNKALALAFDHRRQFGSANIRNRIKVKDKDKDARGSDRTRIKTKLKPKTRVRRQREERMSLFLDLAKQHRLLLSRNTVMNVAEYFADADCYTSFIASYSLIKDPSELLGMSMTHRNHSYLPSVIYHNVYKCAHKFI